MRRKVKVWNKIRLYETSAVGIPAYPDAHASASSFSLVKALSNASLRGDTGFVEESEDMSDTIKSMEEEMKETMEEKSQTAEVPEVTKKAEVVETKAEVVTEKKEDMSEAIAKAIREGIKEGIKEFETERGLVEKQTPKVKSLGEMAIDQGLFVRK